MRPTTSTTTARSLAVGVVASLLLASCGGGAEPAAGDDAAPTAEAATPTVVEATVEETVTATETATTEPTDEATVEATDDAQAEADGDGTAPDAAVPVDKDDGADASAQGLDAAPTGSTGPVQADPSGGPVLFTGVRVAAQNGFDRVVLEYEGDGVPGYQFSYQAEASQQATGDPIDLPGGTGLRGNVRGIAWTEPGNYEGPKRISAAGTRSVTQVDVGVLFEGDQDPYIGVVEEKPYRVTVLENPTRIVVDIAH